VINPQLLTMSPTDPRLRANSFNTNVVSPENEAKLEESIRRNGMFKPIVVREIDQELLTKPPQQVLEIIGGEHRWEIARRIGLTEIPVVNLGRIDDRKAKEISIIDNARYGIDDTLSFSELLKELGNSDVLQTYLPYTETDFAEIFTSADISLEDLGLAENDSDTAEKDEEPKAAKAPKTHTIMRFKVGLADAEKLTALVASTQKKHGLTASDELTNAGDALIQLLFGAGEGASDEDIEEDETYALDDLSDLDDLDVEADA
jgi:ParB-like chromosome segregation protein Spo0J